MHCSGYNLLYLIQRFRQTIQSVYKIDKGIINCRFLDTVLRDISTHLFFSRIQNSRFFITILGDSDARGGSGATSLETVLLGKFRRS